MSAPLPGWCGYTPTGYRMINSVEITNFRSFDSTVLKDCRRINLIVGENGSGKTALLEAIFLAAGPGPEIALRTRAWRGYGGGGAQWRISGTTEEIERALWADLFHKFQINKHAAISLEGDQEHTRSVIISYQETAVARQPNRHSRRANKELKPNPHPLEFKWSVPHRLPVSVSPFIDDGEIKFPAVPESLVKSVFFAANQTYSGIETANRFSILSRTFKSKQFIEMFKRHFTNVLDLSVETVAGMAMLFAHVKDIPEKIPLSLASGGMNKLAAILLAMPAAPGGVVLVDEIENGVYYRRLPLIWESLLELARATDSQVFVSTHSAECIAAASDIAANAPGEFSVIRTVMEDGATKIRHFSGQKFALTLEQHLDIR